MHSFLCGCETKNLEQRKFVFETNFLSSRENALEIRVHNCRNVQSQRYNMNETTGVKHSTVVRRQHFEQASVEAKCTDRYKPVAMNNKDDDDNDNDDDNEWDRVS